MPVPNDGQPQLTEKDIEEAKATYERDLIAWNARNDIETISNKFAKFVSEEI